MSEKKDINKLSTENGKAPLDDAKLEQVNSGMKVVVTQKPKFFDPILRLIFKIKKIF